MRLDVQFATGTEALKVEFTSGQSFGVDFGQLTEVGKEYEHYDGNYDVVPGRDGTVLETQDRVLDDDVVVHPIPFFRVSNLSGGTTCYIGGPQDMEITRRVKRGKQ